AEATGGVAFVQADGAGFTKKMYFATQAELLEMGTTFCPNASTKTHPTTVVGAAAADQVNVTLGGQQVSTTGTTPNISLVNVPDGARDLIAARNMFAFVGGSVLFTLDRLILRRNV